jgi:Tubulin like
MKKTLILGLGGTGFEVAWRTKELLASMYGQNLPRDRFPIRFLCIDFDLQSNAIGPLTPDETLLLDGTPIIADAINAFDHVDPSFRTAVAPWAERDVLDLVQGHRGAQQLRSLGRLLLFRKGREIRDRLTSALHFPADASLEPRPDVAGTEIIIIASSCGGTGAGLLLDVAAWAREGRDRSVTAMTAVRAAYDLHDVESRTFRNYYCLLKELSALSTRKSPLHDYSTANRPWRFQPMPIDRLLVFDNAGGGPGVGGMTLNELYSYMADVVALWPVVIDEAEQAQAFRIPAGRPMVADAFDALASSAGCAMFGIPNEQDLTTYIHARASSELLADGCTTSDAKQAFATEARETIETRIGLAHDKVFDDLVREANSAVLKDWAEPITQYFATKAGKSLDRSVRYDKALYSVFFEDGAVTDIPFPMRDTEEVAQQAKIRKRLDDLLACTKSGRTFLDWNTTVLLLETADSARKLLTRTISELQPKATAHRGEIDEIRDKYELAPDEHIRDLMYERYGIDIARKIAARPIFAALRAISALQRLVDEFIAALAKHKLDLDTYVGMIDAVDQEDTAELGRKAQTFHWSTYASATQCTLSILPLLQLVPACELIFAEWCRHHAIGPHLIDSLERHFPRQEGTEAELRSTFTKFLQAKPVVNATELVRTVIGSPAVTEFAARAANRKAFEEGGQKNLVTNNFAFVIAADEGLKDSLTAATTGWNMNPNGVRHIRKNIRINDRDLVGVAYLHSADTLLNLPEIAISKKRHDAGAEMKQFFTLDKRFETAAGLPELVTDLINHPFCHKCRHDLSNYPRESTFECPSCGERIRAWCGRNDCNEVVDAAYTDRSCPNCRRVRLPLYFKCDRHQWQSKSNDFCPECIKGGEPNPTTWRRTVSAAECVGCRRDGRTPPRSFSVQIMELLDGIDNASEAADAERVYSDGMNFLDGACITCGHLMMPLCPYGPADPAVAAVHYPLHQLVDGMHVYDCTMIHVDEHGNQLIDKTIYTCGSCGMPRMVAAGSSTVQCERCGTENLVCAFHNTPGYYAARNRHQARQLVNPDRVGGKSAAAGVICPICGVDMKSPFPAAAVVASPGAAAVPTAAAPTTRTCAICGFSSLMSAALLNCPACGELI